MTDLEFEFHYISLNSPHFPHLIKFFLKRATKVPLELHFILSSTLSSRAGPIQMFDILWINPLPTRQSVSKSPGASLAPVEK